VKTGSRTTLMIVLIAAQVVCAMVFIGDVMSDSITIDGRIEIDWHLAIEAAASIGLIFGIIFESMYLRNLLARSLLAEQNVKVASGALGDVIFEYFQDWGLTPSEKDVALFAIKGMSNSEIASLRQSSEGTIKAHMNAVFRKAGVSGRNQLVSLLVEDLMDGILPQEPAIKA